MSFLLMCSFRQETIQHSFFTFKHCVGNGRTFSWADPSIVVKPLTVIQQNKNSNPERMKEDSKRVSPGLVLSNGKSLRVVCLLTNLGFLAVGGESILCGTRDLDGLDCAAEVPVSPPT